MESRSTNTVLIILAIMVSVALGTSVAVWGRPDPEINGPREIVHVIISAVFCSLFVFGTMLLAHLVFAFRSLWEPSRKSPRCGKCNYDLTGNVSGRCPECGRPLDPAVTR